MKLNQCRLRIVNYFDDVISDVDFKTEQVFIKRLLDEVQMEQVIQRREELISRIKQVQDHNLAQLNKIYKEDEFERLATTEIDNKLFNKFCFFVRASIIYKCAVGRLFGHFVVVDRFIREETLAAFSQNSLLFEFEKRGTISITSYEFRADNLMIETTIEELFRLKSVFVCDTIIKAIKEPARELFENIQRVEYVLPAFSQENIESLRLIGRHADYISLSCDNTAKFKSSTIAPLSDIKIKSLRLIINKSSSQPFQVLDLLLPFVHLEELKLSANNKDLAFEHKTVKFDQLRKLRLEKVEVDVQFIECFENLKELVIERMPKTAKAIMKKLKLMTQMESVIIWKSSMHEIVPESFNGLRSTTSLDLNSTHIEKIHENAFLHLNNLTHLNLGENSLDTLDSGAFNGLTSLTSLNLSKCRITSLDRNLFNNLRSLTHLDLSGNRLTTICKSISGLTRLKELHLKENSIKTLNGHIFKQLVNLETLDLSHNKIKAVKPNAFQRLTKLEKLSLNDNKISSIDADSLRGLSSLKEFCFSGNICGLRYSTSPQGIVHSFERYKRNHL